jgi:hypothetical protein
MDSVFNNFTVHHICWSIFSVCGKSIPRIETAQWIVEVIHWEYCHVLGLCDYRQGFDWRLDLLTTYTHDLKVQGITAPPLSSIIYKSRPHTLSLFQPAVSSPTFPWQRLLTGEILQLHATRFYLHSLPCRTQLSTKLIALTVVVITSHPLLREGVYRAVAQKRSLFIRLSRGRCMATAANATI